MHNLFAGILGFFMGVVSFFHGGHTVALANNSNQAVLHAAVSGTPAPSGTPRRGFGPGKGAFQSIKGTKLADNKFLAPHAFLVYPVTGDLPQDTQTALTGWKVSSTQNSDGTATVTLTPVAAEQDDHKQAFTVTSGEKVYFIEMNPQDDQNTEDTRWMDDYGIVVDANGVIQNDMPKPSFPPRGQGRPEKPQQ